MSRKNLGMDFVTTVALSWFRFAIVMIVASKRFIPASFVANVGQNYPKSKPYHRHLAKPSPPLDQSNQLNQPNQHNLFR